MVQGSLFDRVHPEEKSALLSKWTVFTSKPHQPSVHQPELEQPS